VITFRKYHWYIFNIKVQRLTEICNQ